MQVQVAATCEIPEIPRILWQCCGKLAPTFVSYEFTLRNGGDEDVLIVEIELITPRGETRKPCKRGDTSTLRCFLQCILQ